MPPTVIHGAAAFLALTTAATLHAQTRVIYVDQSAPTGGDGGSWETAFANLHDACEAANGLAEMKDLEIHLARGTYRETRDIDANLHPTTTASHATLTILGAFGGRLSATPDARDYLLTPTILSGDRLANDDGSASSREDNAFSALGIWWENAILSYTLVVDGLQFRDFGQPGPIGGPRVLAIYSEGRDARVSNCAFMNNFARSIVLDGYGMYEVASCEFRENRSFEPGSCIASAVNLDVVGCRFAENISDAQGGAVFHAGGVFGPPGLHIERSVFLANRSGTRGGAVFDVGGLTWITDCLFAGNASAISGGALHAAGLAFVVRTTLADNRSPYGAAFLFSGFARVEDSILAASQRLDEAPEGAIIEGSLDLSNSLAEHGIASLDAGPMGSVRGLGSLLFASPQFRSAGGTDGDPVTVEDNDYRLRPRSPAVDRGAATFAQMDADGNPRTIPAVLGRPARPDLGCYESQLTLCPADMDADGGIDVDDFVRFLAWFEDGDARADVRSANGELFPDDAVTIDDLLYFLARFEAGC